MNKYDLNTPSEFLNALNAKNQINELVDEVNNLKKKFKKMKKKQNELQDEVETLNKLIKGDTVKEKTSKPLATSDDIFIDRIIKGEDTCSSDLHEIEVRWD